MGRHVSQIQPSTGAATSRAPEADHSHPTITQLSRNHLKPQEHAQLAPHYLAERCMAPFHPRFYLRTVECNSFFPGRVCSSSSSQCSRLLVGSQICCMGILTCQIALVFGILLCETAKFASTSALCNGHRWRASTNGLQLHRGTLPN